LGFINVDLIAVGLSPFDPDRAALRAGRTMLNEIKHRVLTWRLTAWIRLLVMEP